MGPDHNPSREDFLRAKAAMRQDDRGLSEVRSRLMDRFGGRGLHEFMLFYSRKTDSFGAYAFYETDRQIEEADASGLAAEIRHAVIEELESAGRGSAESLAVTVEFDSHETVVRSYGGDYFTRLR